MGGCGCRRKTGEGRSEDGKTNGGKRKECVNLGKGKVDVPCTVLVTFL